MFDRRVKAAILAIAVLSPAAAFAEDIWAVTTFNNLINFQSNNPWVFNSRPISGLQVGEDVIGIDFRPATPAGRLYALGSTGRIYLLSAPSNGIAVQVGMAAFGTLTGTNYGFDFNPTVDRIRIVGDDGQNLRVHPDTGALVLTDGSIAYAAMDPNNGMNADATAAAYSNNVPTAMTTTLYDLDTNLDVLATQLPPNSGTLNTVGPLGIDATGVNGFDISGATAVAYAALDTGSAQSSLYTINLSNGAATLAGIIGCQEPIRGLSVSNDVNVPVQPRSWSQIKGLYSR